MLKKHMLYIPVAFLALISQAYKQIPQENHAPVVKIVSPANQALFGSATSINYRVSVSDKEDGDTKYDEINTKEILIRVSYVKDKSKLQAILSKPEPADAPALAVIAHSNCLNCHDFNGKSIGPSFLEICKHYPATKANADSMARRIKNGSAGVWGGKEKMPSHPELSDDEIRSTVQWIFKESANPAVTYYHGTPGVIHIPQNRSGTYLITASYTDHGVKNSTEKNLKGYDRVVIAVK